MKRDLHALPEGLAVSFLVAADELGMASAARLFVEEIAATSGAEGVSAARDAMGRTFAVFDAVASWWLEHGDTPPVDVASVLPFVERASRVLLVGTEADALDRLVPRLHVPIGLVAAGSTEDAERNAANYRGRVEVVALERWGTWAGSRSALIAFIYGADAHVANVTPGFLRLVGPDVRTAFRALIGWNLLGPRPRLHPRYLVETNLADFSHVVGAERPPA